MWPATPQAGDLHAIHSYRAIQGFQGVHQLSDTWCSTKPKQQPSQWPLGRQFVHRKRCLYTTLTPTPTPTPSFPTGLEPSLPPAHPPALSPSIPPALSVHPSYLTRYSPVSKGLSVNEATYQFYCQSP